VGKMSPFESAWSLLKAGGWKDLRGVGYGQTGEDLDTDFPEPESRQEQLQHASPLGDMRFGRLNRNSALANMSIEEAEEFNRQTAQENLAAKPILPANISPQPLEEDKRLRRQKELGLESEPEDDYPFVGVKPRIDETNPFA